MNIRQKLHELALSNEEKLLRKHGVVSDHGHLTDLGRRVVLDTLFEEKSLRDAVVADIKKIEDEEKKAAK